MFVEPDIRRKRISVTIQTSRTGTIRLNIEGTQYGMTGQPGRQSFDFPEYEMWSPDSPKLYTLRCELLQGDVVLAEAPAKEAEAEEAEAEPVIQGATA